MDFTAKEVIRSSLTTRYALITPARNEAAFIGLTIKSVISQIIQPIKWTIVSDGSTDGTDQIVQEYVESYPWIELVRMPEREERDFGGKARAFNAGLEHLRGVSYDYIGSLDADISFEPDYFEFLLSKLDEDQKIGVVGTPFREGNYSYDYRYVSIEHVSGACQLFRRQCLEEIGGYVAIKGGGIDHIAVLTARMKGWTTRTFTEKIAIHHRNQGSATRSLLLAKFHVGKLDYALGSHPLWECFRALYQTRNPPFIIGGILILGGYLWSAVSRVERSVTRELMRFRRREQMRRMQRFVLRDWAGPIRKTAIASDLNRSQ